MVHVKAQYYMFDGLFLQQQPKKMKSKRGASAGGGGKPRGKMDKRSSRGVMFENEGLRMRSIEINAEVEKGHNDLRKLQKENQTLKQQVWTLRDEYDKLENLVKGIESSDSEDDDDDDEDDDDEDDESTDPDGASSENQRRNSTISKETMDGVDLLEDTENVEKVYSANTQYPRQNQGAGMDNISGPASGPSSLQSGPTLNATAEQYISPPEHFNLDQLLDFASSFHYDRRKHLTTDEPTTVPVTIPTAGGTASTSFGISDQATGSPSGFPPARRRSATVIEQVSAGGGAAIIKEMKNITLCDDTLSTVPTISARPEVTGPTTTVTYTRSSSYYFSNSLDGSRSQSLGTGLNSTGGTRSSNTSLYASGSSNNLKNGSSSLDAGLPLVSVFPPPRTPLVRLSSIEPNTLMVSVAEMPQLWDITTQEIIDELEQQVGPSLPDIHGVRVAGRAAYISLGRREPLQQLLGHGLTVRGNSVPLIDVTRESVVVGLTGVPHYIADGTLFILLAAFGTIIGEIERRFYKGVDTGERFVRMKLKKLVKLPKYVTVGGCRIVLTVHDRIGSMLPDWAHLTTGSAQITPSRGNPQPPPSNLTNADSNDNPQPSTSAGPNETIVEGAIRKDPFGQQQDSKAPKTFSTRCVVNLKVPDRPVSTGTIPRPVHREAPPPPPNIIQQSPLSPGHVLRVGSLDRNPRIAPVPVPVSSTSSTHPPIPPHPHQAPHPPMQVPQNPNNPQLRQGQHPANTQTLPDCTRSRPGSVVFDETPRDSSRSQPSTSRPTPLANGILRRGSMSQEQEALLPQRQTATATIRSRLRIGGQRPAGSSRGRGQGHRQLGRMESISENTISEDVSDVTPLGGRSRRDSERSSVSGTSKASSASKPRKEVIDLPWCGCWGNGCI